MSFNGQTNKDISPKIVFFTVTECTCYVGKHGFSSHDVMIGIDTQYTQRIDFLHGEV